MHATAWVRSPASAACRSCTKWPGYRQLLRLQRRMKYNRIVEIGKTAVRNYTRLPGVTIYSRYTILILVLYITLYIGSNSVRPP